MPTYDYRCADCGLEIEVVHGVHAHGPGTCAACGGPMRKALTAPAIHFKGSGWAKKDARSATTSKAASKESGNKEGSHKADSPAHAAAPKPDGATSASTSSDREGGKSEAHTTPSKPAGGSPSS